MISFLQCIIFERISYNEWFLVIIIIGLFQVGKLKSKSECTPVQSVAFAKTHKAGSTTLQNIILRYGYLRDLTFAIPAWKGWMFDQTRSFNASTLVRRYVNNPGLEFVKRMSSEECKITVYTCRYELTVL